MKREKRKHIFVNEKQEKDVNKVYVNIKHCVHWGNPPPQKHHPRLSCQAPHLNRKTAQAPLSRQSLLYVFFFCEHPAKSQIFQ